MDLATASALSSLISEQADQLWSAAMAIIVAEIYIACRFFSDKDGKVNCLPMGLLIASIVCHLLSLLFGYLTKGSLVEMTKLAAEQGEAASLYSNAALLALGQFGFIALGVICFVIVACLDFSGVAKVISKKS